MFLYAIGFIAGSEGCGVSALLAQAQVHRVQLSADLDKRVELRRELYAFNTQLVSEILGKNGFGYDSPEFAGVLYDLNPGAVRFPGGTVANAYQWRVDSFEPPTGTLTKWAKQRLTNFRERGLEYGLDAFIDLSRKLSFKPVYVVNIFDNTPSDAVEMLRYIRSRGGDIPFLELGNESYWDRRSANNVKAYIQFARPIAEAIREYDSSIRIGVNIGPFNRRGNYEEIWNAPISRDKDWYDAIIHHEYTGGQGIAEDAAYGADELNIIFADKELAESLEKTRKTHPIMPIWLTEWNIGSQYRDKLGQSMAHLLSQISVFAFMMQHHDDFEIGGLHQIVGNGWGTYVSGENGELIKQPSYYMWRFIGRMMNQADSYVPVVINGQRYLDENLPLYLTIGYGNGNSLKSLVFVNRNKRRVILDLKDIAGSGKTFELTVISASQKKLPNPISMNKDPSRTQLIDSSEAIISPYSISFITFSD